MCDAVAAELMLIPEIPDFINTVKSYQTTQWYNNLGGIREKALQIAELKNVKGAKLQNW